MYKDGKLIQTREAKKWPFALDFYNKDIGTEIEKVFNSRNKQKVRVRSIINDTVAVLLSNTSKFSKEHAIIGLVCGTGTNCAYYDEDGIVRCAEWGEFNFPKGILNSWDLKIKEKILKNRVYRETHVLLSGVNHLDLINTILGDFCHARKDDIVKAVNDAIEEEGLESVIISKVRRRVQLLTVGLLKGILKTFSNPKKLTIILNGSVYEDEKMRDILIRELNNRFDDIEIDCKFVKNATICANLNLLDFK
ncbi:hypothetical protein A0H76_1720 [Hepatospora eriocheir]|uniref:Phosphotransferase n=1 Tax=Hepatospora eriocheir TaxID=1081669 RepID=A0A1X0QGL7_9MICR|nr:hypothetical protein A0H76_1720 [Hepatospora eriocheir]